MNRNSEDLISRQSVRSSNFLAPFLVSVLNLPQPETKFVPPSSRYSIRSAKLHSSFVTMPSFWTHFTLLCRRLFLQWFVRSNLTGGNSSLPPSFSTKGISNLIKKVTSIFLVIVVSLPPTWFIHDIKRNNDDECLNGKTQDINKFSCAFSS